MPSVSMAECVGNMLKRMSVVEQSKPVNLGTYATSQITTGDGLWQGYSHHFDYTTPGHWEQIINFQSIWASSADTLLRHVFPGLALIIPMLLQRLLPKQWSLAKLDTNTPAGYSHFMVQDSGQSTITSVLPMKSAP